MEQEDNNSSDANNDREATTTVTNLEETIAEIEKLLDDAKLHVKMHEAQRKLSNEYIAQAKEEVSNGVAHSERTMVFTMDMAQNAHLPWLGSEQCGDFYYYSPLTQFIHGIASNGCDFTNCYLAGGFSRAGEQQHGQPSSH